MLKMSPVQLMAVLAVALSSCTDHPPRQPDAAAPTIVTPPPPQPRTRAEAQSSPQFKPPAPAFDPGQEVFDASGGRIGVVQTLSPSPKGLSVVLVIDGKLVSVPESKLQRVGPRVISSETKAQILSAAGAPR